MPCYDDRSSYVDNPETKRRLDNVTRLLCSLCRTLVKHKLDYIIVEVSGLPKWWTQHQEEDRRREEREREARNAERRRKRKQLNELAKDLGVKILE